MPWSGSVFIWRERILFVGKAEEADYHALPAIKLCAALEGDFTLSIGTESNSYSTAIIDTQTKHSVHCHGNPIFLLYLLGESTEARELKHLYLANQSVSKIPELTRELSKVRTLEKHRDWKCKDALEVCEKILGELIGTPSTRLSEEIDDNVKCIIEYLYSEIESQQAAEEFNHARFTPSVIIDELKLYEYSRWANEKNFNKEFKKELGVPYPYYFDALRLRAALGQLKIDRADRTIKHFTEIATSVGFTLNGLGVRFRDMLGINARELKGNTRFLLCS